MTRDLHETSVSHSEQFFKIAEKNGFECKRFNHDSAKRKESLQEDLRVAKVKLDALELERPRELLGQDICVAKSKIFAAEFYLRNSDAVIFQRNIKIKYQEGFSPVLRGHEEIYKYVYNRVLNEEGGEEKFWEVAFGAVSKVSKTAEEKSLVSVWHQL